jgi:RND family efflux transporter MFP subunit
MSGETRSTSGRGALAGGAAIIVVAFTALAWWGIASRARAMNVLETETAETSVPAVAVVHPSHGAPQEEVVLPGSMQPFSEAPIYARTSGYLSKRYVEMGARVRANQVLAEIDAPELEQQLQQARADLATADANARLAQITADRYHDLVKSDSVSQQDSDNAAGTLEARRTAVESAQHNVRRLAQLQAFTRITAPFAGVITARNTDVGALIDPGASGGSARELFHIAATDRLRVFVNVPQTHSRAAQPGLTIDLTVAEFPGRRFTGTLVRTSQSIDPVSRTLLAEVDVVNADGALLPGAYVQVHLKLDTPTSTLVLPVNTLVFRGDGVKVAVVRGGNRVSMVPVALGRDFGTDAEIVNGLSPDDAIVVNPPDSLADGQVVRVVATTTPAREGAAR